jgi:hypothetical protein
MMPKEVKQQSVALDAPETFQDTAKAELYPADNSALPSISQKEGAETPPQNGDSKSPVSGRQQVPRTDRLQNASEEAHQSSRDGVFPFSSMYTAHVLPCLEVSVCTSKATKQNYVVMAVFNMESCNCAV